MSQAEAEQLAKNGATSIDKTTFGYLDGQPVWKLSLEKHLLQYRIWKQDIAQQGGAMYPIVFKYGRKCDFGGGS